MKKLMAMLLMTLGGLTSAADNRADIEKAFDRNKGQLYAEYVKALRVTPDLKGKVVFDIEIGKTGDVTACRARSTSMGNSDLPEKLCGRINSWKFKPRVSPITITKPVDFFPAG